MLLMCSKNGCFICGFLHLNLLWNDFDMLVKKRRENLFNLCCFSCGKGSLWWGWSVCFVNLNLFLRDVYFNVLEWKMKKKIAFFSMLIVFTI